MPSNGQHHANMQYWSQHSPNQHYSGYQPDTLYPAMQPTAESYPSNAQIPQTANASQELYNQYSPYSNDILQPEEIFQLDQPLRATQSMAASQTASPPTLLDLGSGNIEQKPNVYELSDSYYSLNDDNSTNSSYNNENSTNCFYQMTDLNMNNNNNNNNVLNNNNINHSPVNHLLDPATATAVPQSYETPTSNYFCDIRPGAENGRRVPAKGSFVNDAPQGATVPSHHQIMMDFQNAVCYNNNNFKEHKRKPDAFNQQNQQFYVYHSPQYSSEYFDIDGQQPAMVEPHHAQQAHHHLTHAATDDFLQPYSHVPHADNQYLSYFAGNEMASAVSHEICATAQSDQKI